MLIAAQIIIACAVGFLFVVGGVGVVSPRRVWPFWSSFASTPLKNAAECIPRALVGAAVIVDAESFLRPDWAFIAGCFLVGSAAVMLVFYRLHNRYAQMVVPPLKPFLRLHSLSAILLGIGILFVWQPAG